MKTLEKIISIIGAGLMAITAAGCGEGYSSRFDDWDKMIFKHNKVGPEVVNHFDIRMKGENIAYMIRDNPNIKPEDIEGFAPRFFEQYTWNVYPATTGVMCLAINGVKPEVANQYDKRFRVDGPCKLAKNNVKPETANKYDEEFDVNDIIYFSDNGVTPEIANKFDKKFRNFEKTWRYEDPVALSKTIIYLLKNGLSPERANSFDSKFSVRDIMEFTKEKIEPETANRYKDSLKDNRTISLIRNNITPETANEYDYDVGSIIKFVKAGVPAKVANGYNTARNFELVQDFISEGIPPEVQRQYDNFGTSDIKALIKAKVPGEIASKYQKEVELLNARRTDKFPPYMGYYDGRSVIELLRNDVGPKTAAIYEERGYGAELTAKLVKAGFSLEDAVLLENKTNNWRCDRPAVGVMSVLIDEGATPENLDELTYKDILHNKKAMAAVNWCAWD